MSQTPKISVIIPTFNRSALARDAIASVRAQTFTDWECIVVDDGSTDDTKAVIEALARDDARIKYIHEENAGQAVARNRGVRAAAGELIAFLDSDDAYLPENLAKKLAVLTAHPEVMIVNGYSWVIERATGRFVDCASYAPTNWLVRREFLTMGAGFDPKQRNVEDMGIRVRAMNAANRTDIEYMLEEPLAIYFLNDAQVSRAPNKEPEVFAKRMESLLPDLDPAISAVYKKFAPQFFSRLANFYALSGRMREAREYFHRSIAVEGNAFTRALLPATFLGRGGYRAWEALLRALQRGVVWQIRLMRAKMRYKESFGAVNKSGF